MFRLIANKSILTPDPNYRPPDPNYRPGQGLIAKGEADLGLYNVSEIPRAKGVVLLGPVPAAVQAYITYDAGVPASNASPSAAMEFLKLIAAPAAAPSWHAAGLELAAP